MKSFKTHFSVIFSIFVLLFSLQCILSIHDVIANYEENLANDYSIVVVATKPLDTKELIKKFATIKSVDELDSNTIIKKIEKNMSAQSLVLLKASIPKFYNIKLSSFPSASDAISMQEVLLKYDGISKVEIFAKTYDKIHRVLKFMYTIVLIFTVMIFVMSILLILKQIRIWMYEHQDKINIMTLFGASFFTKSAVLYKMAVIDSFIATLSVTAIFYIFTKVSFFQDALNNISVDIPKFNPLYNGSILLCVSLFFVIISTTIVVTKVKNR